MKRIGFALLALGSFGLTACELQFSTEGGTKTPQSAPPARPGAPGTPAPAAPRRLGSSIPATSPTTPPATPATPPTVTPTTPTVPTVPGSPPTLTSAITFGGPATTDTTITGKVYFIADGAQKMPDVSALAPAGYLFTKQFAVATRVSDEGFPGIDPAGTKRTTNFAIRYEGPLAVTMDGVYTFKVVADDGAIFYIDNTPIVDNDGSHAAVEKAGQVHLLPGGHTMRVDYYQGATPNVSLQVTVAAPNGPFVPLTSRL